MTSRVSDMLILKMGHFFVHFDLPHATYLTDVIPCHTIPLPHKTTTGVSLIIVAGAVAGGLCVKPTFLVFPAFWGGVGWDVNVRWHLRHEVDATSRMGLGGVGWDVNVRWHLRHEVDATSRMGLRWHLRHEVDATSRMGLGGVGWDVNVRWHLRHEVDATSRMGLGEVGWDVNVRSHLRHEVDATSRMGLGGVGERNLHMEKNLQQSASSTMKMMRIINMLHMMMMMMMMRMVLMMIMLAAHRPLVTAWPCCYIIPSITHIYIYVYVYIYIYIYIYIHIYIYVFYIYIYIHIQVPHTHTHVYMYICAAHISYIRKFSHRLHSRLGEVPARPLARWTRTRNAWCKMPCRTTWL